MSVLRPGAAVRPINALLEGRWSSRAISGRTVEREKLATLFEAARWAPSCFNEQPWCYVIATQDDSESFERMASCLVDGNAWAKSAYLLGLSIAKPRFARGGKPNIHAWHDVGAASLNLFLQATELGLYMHEMAGFNRERAKEVIGLDDDHEPVAMIAIGYPADPAALPEPLRVKESAPRERRGVEQFVFMGRLGVPVTF